MKEENKSLGFVSLYRSLLDWEWYQDGNTTRVFIHCLLKANHQPKKWRGITVETGTFISSRGAIAAELGLSDKEVRTALRHLSETGEVASKSTNKYTIYKVENWDLYQSKGQQRASKGPAKGQQRATNNNDNNDNNENNKRSKAFDPMQIVQESYSDRQILDAWAAFFEMRSGLKGGAVKSEHQTKLLMNSLEKYARTDAERIDVLNQSIMNNWKGLFPLKENRNGSNRTGYQNGDVSGAYDDYIPWDDYHGNV